MSAEVLWRDLGSDEGFAVVDGYRVPYLRVIRLRGGANDGRMSLVLDRPSGSAFTTLDIPDDRALPAMLHFIANAMAIAAGFSSHGQNSRPLNPFGEKCISISSASTDGDENDGESTEVPH